MKKTVNGPSTTTSLSKFLAQSGVCARRKAVTFIQEGAVTVNHEIIREPGYKLQPSDKVEIHGTLVKPNRKIYIVLNKPRDYITTVADDVGRRTVIIHLMTVLGAGIQL
jgi:23S rRNA pseudouridine2605 synthase